MPMIKVQYRGRDLSGEEVHISWDSGGHSAGRTDGSGNFRCDPSGYGTVYVAGKVVFKGRIEGYITVEKQY